MSILEKKQAQIASFLNANNFKSSFYHAGLSSVEKNISFENWMTEKTPIIVATNAFGMGIDKANVGLVIHLDFPTSIENYVQETGRAVEVVKNRLPFYCITKVMFYYLKNVLEKTLLSISEIKEIHRKLYQYFRISLGELSEEYYSFNLLEFSKKYNYSVLKVDTALKILANNGIIEISNQYNKNLRCTLL